MSYTLTVSQASSNLSCDLFPPLNLHNGKYEVGLLSFSSYYSISNVDETNNRLYYDNGQYITIPVGNYELQDLCDYIKTKLLKQHIAFNLFANNNTFKISLRCTVDIDFSKPNTIGSLLGFKNRVLKGKLDHFADNIVDIMKVNAIDIQSNISSGSYINGVPSHSLHMFTPKVAPGFKIIEVPNDVIYLPIDVSMVDRLSLKICNQHGNLVNFRGEEITIRLHIRKLS
jgi:hypothetical protein